MYKLSRLFILITLLSIGMLTLAQQSISYGQTVTGEITQGTIEVPFTFEGTAGDTIMVRMTAPLDANPRLDSYVILQGPDGTQLAADDDTAGSLNSLIGPFNLPQDGTYTVIATRCCPPNLSSGSTGMFELVVNQPELVDLAVGETTSVTLTNDSSSTLLSYESAGDEVLTVDGTLIQGEGPISVNVRRPNGEYYNQYYLPETNATISEFLYIQEPGRYNFTIRREPNFGATGEPLPLEGSAEFSMTLNQAETQPLELGSSAEGTLDGDDMLDFYTVEVGEMMTLRMTGSVSQDSQPIDVQLVEPRGTFISGGNTFYGSEAANEFVVDPIQTNQTGQYLLVVRRFDPDGSGINRPADYTVMLEGTQTPTLESGVEVSDTVGGQAFERVYRFEGEAGQTIRVTIRSLDDSYAPSFYVQGPTPENPQGPGTNFSTNSTLPGSSTLELTLDRTGTYLFRVSNGIFAQDGPAIGQFALVVQIAE